MKEDLNAVLKFDSAIAFDRSNNEYVNSYRFRWRFLVTSYTNQVVDIRFPSFWCYFLPFNIFLLVWFFYIDSIYPENKSNKTIQKYIFSTSSKPKRTSRSPTRMFFLPYLIFHYCQNIQFIVFCEPNT